MRNISSQVLLSGATTTTRGERTIMGGSASAARTFQAYGTTSAGAGSATIVIQVSNVFTPAAATDVDWITMGTITLGSLATTQTTDGFASSAAWRWVRAKVSAISGTDATVTVLMGA